MLFCLFFVLFLLRKLSGDVFLCSLLNIFQGAENNGVFNKMVY